MQEISKHYTETTNSKLSSDGWKNNDQTKVGVGDSYF